MLIKLAAEWSKATQNYDNIPYKSSRPLARNCQLNPQDIPRSQEGAGDHTHCGKSRAEAPGQGPPGPTTTAKKRHCWLTNRKNIPTTIARAIQYRQRAR